MYRIRDQPSAQALIENYIAPSGCCCCKRAFDQMAVIISSFQYPAHVGRWKVAARTLTFALVLVLEQAR